MTETPIPPLSVSGHPSSGHPSSGHPSSGQRRGWASPARPVAAGRVFVGPCLPGDGPGFAGRPMAGRVLLDHPDLLVIDKPYGVPVHYGAKSTDHLEIYLPALSLPDEGPPRLGHRLDKDTTGCLALARHEAAATRLGRLFLQGRVDKGYWAVARGWPEDEDGVIDLPLVKRQVPGCSRMMVDPQAGKPSQTRWRVLGRGTDAMGRRLSWLDLTPLTGRMHQLRAHCEAMGWPLLGDSIYGRDWERDGGRDPSPAEPLHLHARWIALPWSPVGLPVGPPVGTAGAPSAPGTMAEAPDAPGGREILLRAEAPVPPHMLAALAVTGAVTGG